MFDTPPLPHEERRIASAPNGGEIWALAVEPEEALLEYLELFYNLRRAGSVLRKMGAIEFVTTVAPGLRDVLLTGKAIELARRKDKGISPGYDAVVLDAPPTGRITRFLNINTEIAGLAKVGPIRSQADSVMSVLRSKRTAIHLVTLLEEMPVQETLGGIAEIRDAALPVGSIIVNMRRPHVPHELEIVELTDRKRILAGLADAGLDKRKTKIADALFTEAREHAARLEMESVEHARISETGLPIYDLPIISGGIDTAALYELATLLNEQGLV